MNEPGRERILDTLLEHVVYHDREMRIRWANQAACDSAGLSQEAIVGRHCYELWGEAGMLHRHLGNMRAAGAALEQYIVRAPDGAARHQAAAILQQLRTQLN